MSQKALINKAVKIYRSFMGRDPSRVFVMPPTNTKVAVNLGKLIGVVYASDRGHKGKWTLYQHELKSPYPDLLGDAKTHRLFTQGGRVRITNLGLVG